MKLLGSVWEPHPPPDLASEQQSSNNFLVHHHCRHPGYVRRFGSRHDACGMLKEGRRAGAPPRATNDPVDILYVYMYIIHI